MPYESARYDHHPRLMSRRRSAMLRARVMRRAARQNIADDYHTRVATRALQHLRHNIGASVLRVMSNMSMRACGSEAEGTCAL